MRSGKAIRRRIASVRSTQKITRAMGMVAAAKLRKAESALFSLRPHGRTLDRIIQDLAHDQGPDGHPLFHRRPPKRVDLIVLSSDRGLCGAFNQAVAARCREVAFALGEDAESLRVHLVGRKLVELLKRDPLEVASKQDMPAAPTAEVAEELAAPFVASHMAGEADLALLVYNRFVSTVNQEVVTRELLPFDAVEAAAEEAESAPAEDFLFEPHRHELLSQVVPDATRNRMLLALLESRAAEQGARMTAMQGATKAADDMIDKLTLDYNRARQASITQQLMEIVSGAEAQT